MIRRWLPAALVAGAGAASLWARGRLPERVEVGFEGVLPFAGAPPEAAARWMVLWLMPALALLAFALFRMAPTAGAFGRRLFPHAPADVTSPAQFERFGSTYDMIVLAVVLLFVGAHVAMLAAALQAPALAVRILPAVLGVCLVLMGNVMPRLRPNWVAGLRSRRLLEDPQLWRRTHRVFGAAFVVSGLATIAAGLVAPTWGVIVAVVSLLASCLIGWLASTRDGGTHRRASIAVLFLVCARPTGVSAQTPAAVPQPTAPDAVAESPFTFVRGGLTLHGTLAIPRSASGPLPVVLIVAGSGPTDRNANGPLINTNAYAMLAWGLAEHGIASMRYDKRGIGMSAVKSGDPTMLSLDLYVADVAAAAAALAADGRFSSVIMLGHSEGAGLVLQAANLGAPAAGVIMIAAQGRPFAEVLHDQFAQQVDSATVVAIDSAFARFLRGDDTGEVPAIAQSVMIPVYRNFMNSFAAYDPPAEARRFAGRLLIVQGTTDVQVVMRDAELIHAAQPAATLLRLEGVNHVLKSIESMDLQDQLKTYRDPALPLAAPLVPAIARWIEAGTTAR
jgi:hypothetical protein